jgi:hypothetical protein
LRTYSSDTSFDLTDRVELMKASKRKRAPLLTVAPRDQLWKLWLSHS